jgi:thiol-disulfide isomerase/thioredoxin
VNHRFKALCIAGSFLLTGCQPSPLPPNATWRGTLQLPEITIPFRMELDLSGGKPAGSFIVGNEKTPIPEIARNQNALTFSFSEYGAEMRGTWDGERLNGEYLRHRADGTKSFSFSASPEFENVRRSQMAPTGNYQVVFEGETSEEATTVASIWKEGPVSYYGTFIAPDGDYGLLEGMPTRDGIQLSRFTGWQGIAIELKRDGERWSGKFHAAHADKPRAFTLQTRTDSAVEGRQQVGMKNPNAPFTFACTSLTGEVVRNTDERFKGKALAVDIMGTWCHNCMDESPVLEKLYQQYSKVGFEVVGLSFEIKDDAELGKKNLMLFRDRYKLTYPVLYCGSVDDANIEQQLKSQLDNFFAYPTTLFINRKGEVQTIHSGFQGPGTGDRYPLQVEKLHDLAQKALR